MNEIKKILKEIDSNIVELTEYDVGIGTCEVLSVDDTSCTVQFITFCSCYSCCVYGKTMYTEAKTIPYELIAKVDGLPMMSKEEIQKKREESIRLDAPIFERYRGTEN